jgi:4-amino-4-deoxy-L-arabinose transferase-like glycosyltransferase
VTTKNQRRCIFLLVLLSLAVRLPWAAMQPSTDAAIDQLPDQREYLSLGRNLLHDGSLSFVDPRFQQTVYAYRTPGYPVFIAILGGSPLAIRLAQAIIDASTVLAIYLLARQLSANNNVGLLAGFLVAMNPFLIYFCGLLLSETLFTALLAWGLLLLVRRRIILGSAIFFAAVLVRPSALVLTPLLAGVAALNPIGMQPYSFIAALRRPLIGVITVSSVIFIGLLPWAARNHQLLDNWIWTTTNSGVTMYDGFNPAATGASDQRFLAEMPELRSMNEVQRSQYLSRSARSWITDHWRQLPSLTLNKIARTWSPIPLSKEFSRPAYRWISALYAIPFDLLLIIGLISPTLTRRAKVTLLMPAIYFTLVHAMSIGSLRYRVPVEPELAILTAVGVTLISGGAKHRADYP